MESAVVGYEYPTLNPIGHQLHGEEWISSSSCLHPGCKGSFQAEQIANQGSVVSGIQWANFHTSGSRVAQDLLHQLMRGQLSTEIFIAGGHEEENRCREFFLRFQKSPEKFQRIGSPNHIIGPQNKGAILCQSAEKVVDQLHAISRSVTIKSGVDQGHE